jgi:hypothetical protein
MKTEALQWRHHVVQYRIQPVHYSTGAIIAITSSLTYPSHHAISLPSSSLSLAQSLSIPPLLWAPSSSFSLSSPLFLFPASSSRSLAQSLPIPRFQGRERCSTLFAYLYHVLLCQAFVIMLGVFASLFGKIMGCLWFFVSDVFKIKDLLLAWGIFGMIFASLVNLYFSSILAFWVSQCQVDVYSPTFRIRNLGLQALPNRVTCGSIEVLLWCLTFKNKV